MQAYNMRANTHENRKKNGIHKKLKYCNYSEEVCNRNQLKLTTHI